MKPETVPDLAAKTECCNAACKRMFEGIAELSPERAAESDPYASATTTAVADARQAP